jgi:phosphatidylinositol alpha-1,6-mannosyltransferase
MNILLLAENWPPRWGGIENYLTSIAKNLPEKSVTVVAPKARGGEVTGRGIKEVLRYRFFWAFIRPKWLWLYIRLHRSAKREKIDVVLCGKALFEGLIGYYLKKSLGVPYVIFTYAMEIETWGKNPWERKKLERVLKSADRIVYINEVTKQSLLKHGATEKQLVKIWPGVDERFFEAKQPQDILKKYNLKSPCLITLTRLEPRKGIDVLIEAFGQLDQTRFGNWQLLIVGDGPARKDLEDKADTEWIKTSVRFLGRVPDEDVPALLQSASAFALTPRFDKEDIEGFGIVYLEAGASGLPVVGTQGGGVSEAVVHKETGILVQPGSVSAVKEALELLLGNEAERRHLGDAGKKRAWHEFRWSKRILLVKGMLDAILAEQILRRRQSK